MRPNWATAALTATSASAGLVTSSFTTNSCSASPTALRTASVLRPVATTALPPARAALAKSTPMPRPAPVINQTFVSVIGTSLCHLHRRFGSAFVLFVGHYFSPLPSVVVVPAGGPDAQPRPDLAL